MRASPGLVIVTGLVALLAACKSDNEGTRACATAAQCEAGEVCIDSLCRGCDDDDGDGASCDDCDDQNPLVGPNATELCDGLDNDCDGLVDEEVKQLYYADADHDGYGQPGASTAACAAPAGFVANDTDCNDADPTMSPGRGEVCDFKDNDCNDAIDDGVTSTFYRDSDGDGFGDPANVVVGCIQPGGFVAVGGDCDDSRPDVHPDAAETCNARDDDCDGVVDGNTRSCDNSCGAGVETCEAGLFTGCTAPTITTVSTLTQIKGVTLASYTCLLVKSRLVVDADTELSAANWIRVDQGGQIESGPRTKLSAASIAFVGNGALASPEVTLDAATISLEQDARWFIGDAAGVSYSAGGAAACTNGGGQSVGAGAGGARGGGGGKGGSCGAIGTQPRAGAGGANAASGAAGCDCPCTTNATGGEPSGGDGGLAYSGGGGGGGGGAGGVGAAGNYGGATIPGAGGDADGTIGLAPTTGGGGGGGGGTTLTTLAPEACRTAGGSSGGLVIVRADQFTNRGTVIADGYAGQDSTGSTSNAGGGGGGGGGSFVFYVDQFNNLGSITAVGGKGGYGSVAQAYGCTNGAGGGGGGGGGRVWIGGQESGAIPELVAKGNVFVGGGVGGGGYCATAGTNGSPGWYHAVLAD